MARNVRKNFCSEDEDVFVTPILRKIRVYAFYLGKNLKVKYPDKYGWDPNKLLTQLVDIYLNLDCDQFAAALAADEVCDIV